MPIRLVEVPGHGTFEVPTHVSRVDSFKQRPDGQPGRGWHGWQVRWSGFHRFFSDSGCGGVAGALAAAARYAEQHYPGKRSQCDPAAGVRLVVTKKPDRNVEFFYAEAAHPARGASPRRIYIGTANTITSERVERQMRRARALRDELVREHQATTGRY